MGMTVTKERIDASVRNIDTRKADVEAKLVELEYEIALAIRQGAVGEQFTWTQTFDHHGKDKDDPWIAVLTVAKVGSS